MQKCVRAVFNKTKSYWPILLIFESNTGYRKATLCQILKKIRPKLRPWECRKRKMQNGRHDVIKLRYSKFEKNCTGPYPREYLCEISSTSAQPFRLKSWHRHRHTHTHTNMLLSFESKSRIFHRFWTKILDLNLTLSRITYNRF